LDIPAVANMPRPTFGEEEGKGIVGGKIAIDRIAIGGVDWPIAISVAPQATTALKINATFADSFSCLEEHVSVPPKHMYALPE